MNSGSDESACGIDSYAINLNGVVDSYVEGISISCMVGNIGSVVAIEHNVAHDAEDAEIIVITLEEEIAREIVNFFHVGRVEFEVEMYGEV